MNILLAGIGLCLIPILIGVEQKIKFVTTFNIFLFIGLGIYYTFLAILDNLQYSTLLSLSYFFSILALSTKIYYRDERHLRKFKRLHLNKRIRKIIFPLMFASLLLLLTSVGALFIYSGNMYGGDVYGRVYIAIISSPIIITIAAMSTIGMLVKVIWDRKSADMVGNILIIIIPAIFLVFTIVGIVPIPDEIYEAYEADFLAWISYVVLFLLVVVVIGIIGFTFQGVEQLAF